ncbi:MAG: hypothetical protein AABY88_03475 [Pseudomonadota bacterium]
MDNGYQTNAASARPVRRFLLIALFGLLLGLALGIWGLSRSSTARSYLLGTDAAPMASDAPLATVSPSAPSGVIQPTLPPPLPGTDERIAALEARVAQLSRATEAGSGSSGRAEGLLLAFAARRALDRGLALGYVEGQLSNHFGTRQPRAVAMIISAARQPATLDQLKSELETLAPALGGNGPDASWWDGVTQSLSSLFSVRQADAPSTTPKERLTRASDAIAQGRVDQALAEVARLPNRNVAADWMAKAKRYVEAYRALDLLEAAAIIGPSEAPIAPSIALPEPAPTAPNGDVRKAAPDSL